MLEHHLWSMKNRPKKNAKEQNDVFHKYFEHLILCKHSYSMKSASLPPFLKFILPRNSCADGFYFIVQAFMVWCWNFIYLWKVGSDNPSPATPPTLEDHNLILQIYLWHTIKRASPYTSIFFFNHILWIELSNLNKSVMYFLNNR